jgi:hypothetical protein
VDDEDGAPVDARRAVAGVDVGVQRDGHADARIGGGQQRGATAE